MDVLFSWSKQQSRATASALYEWLPKVLPGIEPWMSDKDIAKGKAWFKELQSVLADAKICIICMTAENVRSPWIYYETGAIGAKQEDVLICPYLIGIGTKMLADGPLAQFQSTLAERNDTFGLVKSLNNALDHDRRLHQTVVDTNFENTWPGLNRKLDEVLAMQMSGSADFLESDADQLAGLRLSSEARTLLVAGAQDSEGAIVYLGPLQGTYSANGKTYGEEGNARSEAISKQAVGDLVSAGLLAGHGDLFKLTARGFEVADLLEEQQI